VNGAAWVTVACSVTGALAVIGGGLIVMVRTLWKISAAWAGTNASLAALVAKVGDLVAAKDADHARLERRADEVAERLERHLTWHDRR